MVTENYVQLPADDSNGKKLRTNTVDLGSGTVHMEVVAATLYPSTTPGVIGKAFISATSVSGGVCLTSAAVREVRVKAQHFNSGEIYVGSNVNTSARPYSGVGYILRPDEYVDVETDEAGKVFVFGAISGYCHVTYAGKV